MTSELSRAWRLIRIARGGVNRQFWRSSGSDRDGVRDRAVIVCLCRLLTSYLRDAFSPSVGNTMAPLRSLMDPPRRHGSPQPFKNRAQNSAANPLANSWTLRLAGFYGRRKTSTLNDSEQAVWAMSWEVEKIASEFLKDAFLRDPIGRENHSPRSG
jgi:hypothetical protein